MAETPGQLSEPALSFLLRYEFYHPEVDPFPVAVAHLPEGTGEERLFYGVAKDQAVDKRGTVHGGYDREGNAREDQ